MAKIVVQVMPKAEILDPQGKAIAQELTQLGKTSFSTVRQGKRFELTVDGPVTDSILAEAKKIAENILSNPVIEEIVDIAISEE